MSTIKMIICFSFILMSIKGVSQWTVIDTATLKVEYDYRYRAYPKDTIFYNEPSILLIGDKFTEYIPSSSHERNKVIRIPSDERKDKTGMNFSAMQGSSKGMPYAKTHCFNIFKNRLNSNLNLRHWGSPNYQYSENNIDFQWEIKQETKEILDYSCVKAEGRYMGRDYVAWFAPDVPISDGPYKFHGLPGLILAIEDTQQDHVFLVRSISQYEARIIQSFTHEYKPYGKWILKFIRKCKIAINNGYDYFTPELKQPIIPNTPKKREALLIMGTYTNPIELKLD